MKKPLKIVIISLLTFTLLTGATITVIRLCRPKGQSRNEVSVVGVGNTYLDGTGKTASEVSPTDSLFILALNVKKFKSYHAVLSGTVDAGGMYRQTVEGQKYKSGEESLYISRSTSLLKNTANQIFIENDSVLFRNGNAKTGVYEDTVNAYSLDDYIKEYGTDFRELSNYELNGNTVVKAELVSATDGIYTYRYEIDVITGVNGYRVNMYKMGGLDDLPIFRKSILEVVMTENFIPKSITQTDEYTINMLFTLSCKSTLTETFEKVNEEVVIPERDFFKAKLNG